MGTVNDIMLISNTDRGMIIILCTHKYNCYAINYVFFFRFEIFTD